MENVTFTWLGFFSVVVPMTLDVIRMIVLTGVSFHVLLINVGVVYSDWDGVVYYFHF